MLSISIGDGVDQPKGKRLIYPYFSESPVLDVNTARLGLWLLSVALPDYDPLDIRILDVMRAKAFSLSDNPLKGDEENEFKIKYGLLIAQWDKLYQEY